jgi:hypothetical protein
MRHAGLSVAAVLSPVGYLQYVEQRKLGAIRGTLDRLRAMQFRLIICCAIDDCPLGFAVAGEGTRILLDAREYYPRHYEHQLTWRITRQPYLTHLCKQYLPRCDRVITVCEGIAAEYGREFGVYPEVVMSFPEFFEDLQPGPPRRDTVRMVFHGGGSLTRGIQQMIELMDYVDGRFMLDLMLVRSDADSWKTIARMVKDRSNVRIIPPVALRDIIPCTNTYDIGLNLCPPLNFNLLHSLPNKFFEYIQARLMLAIGPSPEMASIVRQYDCGVIADDFGPRTLAAKLNSLTSEQIYHYKLQSHKAAQELHAGANAQRLLDIVSSLIN